MEQTPEIGMLVVYQPNGEGHPINYTEAVIVGNKSGLWWHLLLIDGREDIVSGRRIYLKAKAGSALAEKAYKAAIARQEYNDEKTKTY